MPRKSKVYPLEIHSLDENGGGNSNWYWSKGHQNPVAFVFEVNRSYDEHFDSSQVKHKYMRWECNGNYEERQVGNVLERPARGAFPITILE